MLYNGGKGDVRVREIPFCFNRWTEFGSAFENRGRLIALESSFHLSCRDDKSLWKQTFGGAGRCIF